MSTTVAPASSRVSIPSPKSKAACATVIVVDAAGRRDHQVAGEVLAGHVDLQPGAGQGQRAGAGVGGGVEVDGEGAAQRDVRDAHGDVAAEAAGVRRPGGGEAAGAVGERDTGQGERGVVEGDAEPDRAGAVEGPGEAEVGVHGEAGDA